MNGIERIAAERRRQIEAEGWSATHDDQYTSGQLASAAGAYAWVSGLDDGMRKLRKDNPPACWPWGSEWWKPGNRIRELEKAGALIAAEIDRLQRAEIDAAIAAQPIGGES